MITKRDSKIIMMNIYLIFLYSLYYQQKYRNFKNLVHGFSLYFFVNLCKYNEIKI